MLRDMRLEGIGILIVPVVIAASRRFYNANVRELNQLCAAFPTNIVARLFKIQPSTFFQLDSDAERVVPRV